jgi:hypothetical protein
MKRFRIFKSRYILAILVLLLPLALQVAFGSIIPSQTNIINSIRGILRNSGTVNLQITNYGQHTVPFTLDESANSSLVLQTMLQRQFSNRQGIRLEQVSVGNLDDYVLNLRLRDLRNLVNNYFVGMSLSLSNRTARLSADLYFSRMAFHSSAAVINEMNNLLLAYITNDSNKTITTYNSPIPANTSQSVSTFTNYLESLACIDSLPVSLLNFLNSLIVAFIGSILVIHVARERSNGSKQLQMLSGIHYGTYWISNYMFDLLLCLFNVVTLVVTLKVIEVLKNDPSNEISVIASNDSIGYYFLLLFFSCFSWCTYAYLWSFFFKSELISFIVLLIILGLSSFIDVILTFLQLTVQINTPDPESVLAGVISAFRIILVLLLPNVICAYLLDFLDFLKYYNTI